MVTSSAVRSAISQLSGRPIVAAFFGGTLGIGEYTIRQLANLHAKEGNLRVYIVGRNAQAASVTISACQRTCPKGQFIFIQIKDLSLLKEVDQACVELTKIEKGHAGENEKARIDLLVLSHARPPFLKRTETSEGLDFLGSLLYYSRARIIDQLLPLLLATTLPPAHVISVFAAGTEDKLYLDDLSLRDPTHSGYFRLRSHVVYLTTIYFEHMAKQYEGKLSLTHVFPGLVDTPGFKDPATPWWFRTLYTGLKPLARFMMVTSQDIGDRILYLATSAFPARGSDIADFDSNSKANRVEKGESPVATATDGIVGGGAYSVNEKSEIIPANKAWNSVDKPTLAEKGWEHTMKVFQEIAAGRKFTE